MQISSLLPFHHLNWNSKKKSFEIHDTTDRKIVSFLCGSVLPTYYIEKDLDIYPRLKKKITDVKFYFLKQIDTESEANIKKCPVKEYNQVLNLFYNDIKKQINEFNVNSVPNSNALFLMQKICTDCFKELFTKTPLNMLKVDFCDLPEKNKEYLNALNEGQCYHYAFYLAKEYEAMMSMIPFESSCNAAFLLYPKYFLQHLGYSETDNPVKGDLVLYLGDPKKDNNSRFKHLGMMTEKGTIKSSWRGFGCEFEHEIFQVPTEYGSEVIFFHKTSSQVSNFNKILKTTNQMSKLILKIDSQFIPTPLTNLGILFFLLDILKLACKDLKFSSEQGPWEEIEKNLHLTINPLSLKRVELCVEFKLWMQEMLQQYVIDLF